MPEVKYVEDIPLQMQILFEIVGRPNLTIAFQIVSR